MKGALIHARVNCQGEKIFRGFRSHVRCAAGLRVIRLSFVKFSSFTNYTAQPQLSPAHLALVL